MKKHRVHIKVRRCQHDEYIHGPLAQHLVSVSSGGKYLAK